jgi:hypothetical protein
MLRKVHGRRHNQLLREKARVGAHHFFTSRLRLSEQNIKSKQGTKCINIQHWSLTQVGNKKHVANLANLKNPIGHLRTHCK